MPLPIQFPNPFADEDEINAAMMNALAEAVMGVAANIPLPLYRGTMFHDESVVITGGAIELVLFASGGNDLVYARQATPALNDEFKNGMYLAADTYSMQVIGYRDTGSGIVSWYVDDVLVGTSDLYDATPDYTYFTISSIVIATSGWHTIKGKVASKNASSSGYQGGIFKVSMTGSLA